MCRSHSIRKAAINLLATCLIVWPLLAYSENRVSPLAITLTEVPGPGAGSHTWGTIAGMIESGQEVAHLRVVIYSLAGGLWWVQPFADHRAYTMISARDATFRTHIHKGYEYAALLVEPHFRPPATVPTLPTLGGGVLAIVTAPAQ